MWTAAWKMHIFYVFEINYRIPSEWAESTDFYSVTLWTILPLLAKDSG